VGAARNVSEQRRINQVPTRREGTCFAFCSLIGITWCMGVGLHDSSLPRWLRPREGDVLPHGSWGERGHRGWVGSCENLKAAGAT